MNVEIVKARPLEDILVLANLDRQVFGSADLYPELTWKQFENYLLLIDGIPVGSTALVPHHRDDSSLRGIFPEAPGVLYTASTGVLPKYQKGGFGQLFKSFHIAYARIHGFGRIVTCARLMNAPIIKLNSKFGFLPVRVIPEYYKDPVEDRVVFELKL